MAIPSDTRLRLRAWLRSSTNCGPIVITRQLLSRRSRSVDDAARDAPAASTSSACCRIGRRTSYSASFARERPDYDSIWASLSTRPNRTARSCVLCHAAIYSHHIATPAQATSTKERNMGRAHITKSTGIHLAGMERFVHTTPQTSASSRNRPRRVFARPGRRREVLAPASSGEIYSRPWRTDRKSGR